MERKIIKKGVLYFVLTVLLIINSTAGALALVANDVQDHWGRATIEDWLTEGLASGYPSGEFRPDGFITRAEFITLVNQAFRFMEESNIDYADVLDSDWFFADIRKAQSAGYIKGYPDGSMRPNEPISRQEAAIIITTIMGLKEDHDDAERFTDKQDIPEWSKGHVGVVAATGFMGGYPDGSFRPLVPITRAESLVALDRAIYDGVWVIRESGDHGPEDDMKTFDGDTLMKSESMTLRNVIITGDLILTDRSMVEVILENVTIKGKVIVKGSSVTIITKGQTIINEIDIDEDAKEITIEVSKDTIIDVMIINAVISVVNEGRIKEALGPAARSSSYLIKLPDNLQPRPSSSRPPVVETGFAGGSGTEQDPYKVATAEQLNNVRNYLDKHFIQTADIDLDVSPWNEGEGWDPIGSELSPFEGEYDGGGHEILNLRINRSSNYQGLFGFVSNAAISDINLVSAEIIGNNLYTVGTLVGWAYWGTIIDSCSATGSIIGTGTSAYAVGGLVGTSEGVISNSVAHVTVTVPTSGSALKAGGLVGHNGWIIENSQAHGNVTGMDHVGGLAGWHSNNTISNSYSTGTVTGSKEVGGLVGLSRAPISISYSIGNVTGGTGTGGLIGINSGTSATISDSYATGTVTAVYEVGGLVGKNEDATITSSYASGAVTGTGTDLTQVGGLVGFNFGNENEAIIRLSYAIGNVTGISQVGGLVGANNANGKIEKSYARGSIIGTRQIGGLVGANDNIISNTYAAGSVEGDIRVGGLVGYNLGSVNRSYAIGAVEGTGESSHIGGLVGEWVDSQGDVSRSYYYQLPHNGIGSVQEITEMIQKNTYEDWDFGSVWEIIEGNSYPYLRWQDASTVPYPPSPFAGGSGTEADPYQVSNAEQLNQVRNYLDKHFIQTDDIDLGVAPWNEGEGWEPIGDYVGEASFKGVYDGNNCIIDGLFINRPEKDGVGLFGETTHGSVVKNLKIFNVDVIGRDYVGAVSGGWGGYVSLVDSTLINVHVSGSVAGREYIGGLIGINSTIRYSSSTADVNGTNSGGLAGMLTRYGNVIEKSFATGEISGSAIGGLIGHNNYGRIIDSYSMASVKGTGLSNGGIIGQGYHSESVLSNVFAAGVVDNGGGLIGVNHNGGSDYELTSYWDREVTGKTTSANSDISFGKTTAEMKLLETYISWDFDEIWGLNPDVNNGYPFLRWQGYEHAPPY